MKSDNTFVLASDIPYKDIISDVVKPERMGDARVYAVSRLSYAAIVGFIRVVRAAILDFSNDRSPVIDKLASLLKVMPLKCDPEPSITRKATLLLKAIYFLILATKNGSNIAERLLDSVSTIDEESKETYAEYKSTLDSMFDEYTGFGEPVCAEIVDTVTTLIDFVKQQSGRDIK